VSLPSAFFTDGAQAIEAAFQKVFGKEKGMLHFLGLWHVEENLQKHLKSDDCDPQALKLAFYNLVDCQTESAFTSCWDKFLSEYGGKEGSATFQYINTYLWSIRKKIVAAFVDGCFKALLRTTGISESMNSLFASSTSGSRGLDDLFELIEVEITRRIKKHQVLSDKWIRKREKLTIQKLPSSLALSAAVPFLSGFAIEAILSARHSKSSVCKVEPIEISHGSQFNVTNPFRGKGKTLFEYLMVYQLYLFGISRFIPSCC